MSRFDLPSVEELINISKLNALLNKKEEEKKKNTILWVLAIIGSIAAIAGIAFAVYKFLTPDYLEEYEDYEDDFDDDFFDEEFEQEEVVEDIPEETAQV